MRSPVNLSSLIHTTPDPYGVRNAERLRVKVDVRPVNGQTVCGQFWPHGESEQVVYKDQFEREVMPLVATPEEELLFKQATETHKVQMGAYLRENKGKNEGHYSGSVETEFFRMTGRGRSPIASLVVIEEVEPPDTPEARADRATDRLADAIATAMTKAAGGGQAAPAKGSAKAG